MRRELGRLEIEHELGQLTDEEFARREEEILDGE
jgi:hypothetical protein